MALTEHNDVEQGSDEWLALRRGIVTASTVGQLLETFTLGADAYDCTKCDAPANQPCVSIAKGKEGTPITTIHGERTKAATEAAVTEVRPARTDDSKRLVLLLVTERITGESDYREQYLSNDMLAGQLDEPLARDAYSEHHAPVAECGFMIRDDWGFLLGYSPDGLVGDDGLIEVKSPRAKEHVRTVLADEVPARYMPQLQAGLLVSGREWCDYVSFSGGLPLYTKRVYADPKWQTAIVDAVAAFEQQAVEMVHNFDLATRGLPATERRVDLSTLHLEVI